MYEHRSALCVKPYRIANGMYKIAWSLTVSYPAVSGDCLLSLLVWLWLWGLSMQEEQEEPRSHLT